MERALVRKSTLDRIVAAIEGPGFQHGIVTSAAHGRLVPVCAEIDAELAGRGDSRDGGGPLDPAVEPLAATAREWAERLQRGAVVEAAEARALAALLSELADVVSPIDAPRH
ncbi:hypothetical protein DCE94_11400 [Agromyces badenianii]|nr:hypothetical protein DCE94_11400 [Agromyces badenianii]